MFSHGASCCWPTDTVLTFPLTQASRLSKSESHARPQLPTSQFMNGSFCPQTYLPEVAESDVSSTDPYCLQTGFPSAPLHPTPVWPHGIFPCRPGSQRRTLVHWRYGRCEPGPPCGQICPALWPCLRPVAVLRRSLLPQRLTSSWLLPNPSSVPKQPGLFPVALFFFSQILSALLSGLFRRGKSGACSRPTPSHGISHFCARPVLCSPPFSSLSTSSFLFPSAVRFLRISSCLDEIICLSWACTVLPNSVSCEAVLGFPSSSAVAFFIFPGGGNQFRPGFPGRRPSILKSSCSSCSRGLTTSPFSANWPV